MLLVKQSLMCNSDQSSLDECVVTIEDPILEECSICLESIDETSDSTIRLYCKHVYHIPCYRDLVIHARRNGQQHLLRCPVCRDVLDDLYYTTCTYVSDARVRDPIMVEPHPNVLRRCSGQLVFNCAVCLTLLTMLGVVGVYWSGGTDSN